MTKLNVLRYEIRRLISTKQYLYSLLIISLLTYDVLNRLLIGGFKGTAPFSPWSYSEFLALVISVFSVIVILMWINVFSEKEQKVRGIIFSAPITQSRYYLIKGIAIGLAASLILLVIIILSFGYYYLVYGFSDYGTFIMPMVYFICPSFLISLGLGLFIGKINVKILYLLIPLFLVIGLFNLGLPGLLDLTGGSYLFDHFNYLNLEVIEKYTLTKEFLCSRMILIVLGLCLFGIGCRIKQ